MDWMLDIALGVGAAVFIGTRIAWRGGSTPMY